MILCAKHGLIRIIDKCGNEATGLFSYIQIGQGSGVVSGSSVSPTPFASSDSVGGSAQSPAAVTVNQGTTLIITSFIPSDPTITISATRSSGDATNPRTTGSPAGSSLNSNQSSESIQTTPVPMERSPSFWDSTGKVAGVFVTVGIVTALLAGALLWMCRRRGRRDEEKTEEPPGQIARQVSGGQPVSRSASLLQLLGKRDKGRREDVTPPSPNENYRLSRTPTELVMPVVDQRLDPQTMMIRFEDNISRTSFRDEEDYSRRVWRVTNASDSDSVRSTDISANS
jgi:cell wall integrity and stress response component